MSDTALENVDFKQMEMVGITAELETVVADLRLRLRGAEAALSRINNWINTPYVPVVDAMNVPLPVEIKCLNRKPEDIKIFLELNNIKGIDEVQHLLEPRYVNREDGIYLSVSVVPGFLEAHKESLLKSGIVTGCSANTPPDSICRSDLESRLTLSALVRYKKQLRQKQQDASTKGLQ